MSKLKSNILSGVFYTGIAKYSGLIISIGVSAILARILSPNEFGIVAIASVFISFFSTLTTVGISPAIIQNKSIRENDLTSINTFTFLIAIFSTFFYIILVPFIADIYKSEILKHILYLLSLNIFFSIISIVPNALLLKYKKFKFIAIRTFVIQLVLGIISIIAAYNGIGIYTLLIAPIGSSFLLFFISYKAFPIKFSKIASNSIYKILSFSVYQMVFNLIYLGYRNIDKILIGKYMGIDNLGYYEKSYRIMMLPLENVSTIISPILHPLLSEYQKDYVYLWEVYKKMIAFLSEFSFIISVILYFLADFVIIGLFGNNWTNAVPIFRILSLSICFQLIQSPVGAILQAANSVKMLVYGAAGTFICVLFSLLIVILYGNFCDVAVAIDIAFLIGFVIYQVIISNVFRTDVCEIWKIVLPHIGYSVILFILLYLVDFLCSIFLFKGIIIVVVSIVYFMILYKLHKLPNLCDFLKNLIRINIR